jgi:hypothetical protein
VRKISNLRGLFPIVLQVAALSAAAAAGAAVEVPALLAADNRLEVTIAAAVADRPLGEALPEIGRALGVPLSAGREVADDRITLFIRERPAREVLALISSHFNFQWRRDGDGYRLGQDLASRDREQALLEAEIAAEVATLRRRLARVMSLGHLDRQTANAQLREVSSQLSGNGLTPEERARLVDEIVALQAASEPYSRIAVEVFRYLPAARREAVWRGLPARLSTGDGSLPPQLVPLIQEGLRNPDLKTEDPRIEIQIRLVSHELGRPIGGPPPGYRLVVETSVFDPSLSDSASAADGGRWVIESRGAELAHIEPPDDDDLRELVELPVPTPRRLTLEERVLTRFEEASPFSQPLSHFIGLLHAQGRLDFIADSYTRARLDPGMAAPLYRRGPLRDFLADVGHRFSYDWSKDGSLVRLRSRRYVRDRREEVPDRLLKSIRAAAGKAGFVTLDDYAALAAALTDDQVLGLGAHWGYYFPARQVPPLWGAGFYNGRQDLRFWHSLSEAQRNRARSRGLPVTALTPVQLQRLHLALSTSPPPLARETGRPPLPEELPLLRVGMVQSERLRQDFVIADERAEGGGSTAFYSRGEEIPEPPSGEIPARAPVALRTQLLEYRVGPAPVVIRSATFTHEQPDGVNVRRRRR